MIGPLVSILWNLLGSQGQAVIVYLGSRLFVPPTHIPILDRLPMPARMVPGTESAFERAVIAARSIYYYMGVGEGFIGGIIFTAVFVLIVRFIQDTLRPARAPK